MTTSEPGRRAEAVCQAALAVPLGEREAYLGDVCAGDAALRLAVESLLESRGTTADPRLPSIDPVGETVSYLVIPPGARGAVSSPTVEAAAVPAT